jgi:hypothetical protein
MVSKQVWLAGVGAALAGPYLALDGNLPGAFHSGRDNLFGRDTPIAMTDDAWLTSLEQAATAPDLSAEALTTPVVNLGEALRLEIQPDWVLSRWPRVATVVGELDWAGMRVPLITGYQPHDMAGSLTYYFDSQQRLRRMALEGFTGDERMLVSVATQTFGLVPEPSRDAGLYVYRWNGEPLSVLSVQYAPLMSSDTTLVRRRVMLEINCPVPGWRLSPQMQALAGRGSMPTF